jgi:hypothetical protein
LATPVEELNQSIAVSVYPNPILTQATFTISSDLQKASFKVYDMNGEEVKQITFSGKQVILERENLKAGVYFYRIVSQEKTIATGKLIMS